MNGYIDNRVRYRFTVPVGNLDDVQLSVLMRNFNTTMNTQYLTNDGNLRIPDDIWMPSATSNVVYNPAMDVTNKKPSYCCQQCGEPIGWLGRFFQWLPFKIFKHKCKSEFPDINQ